MNDISHTQAKTRTSVDSMSQLYDASTVINSILYHLETCTLMSGSLHIATPCMAVTMCSALTIVQQVGVLLLNARLVQCLLLTATSWL